LLSVRIYFCFAFSPPHFLLYSYTWGTSRKHGFHGVYLGDLERLQDIQRKRDVTNRDWQRIILRNIAKSLIGQEEGGVKVDLNDDEELNESLASTVVFETRQLWWQLHTKMREKPEYEKMLLLVRMKDHLEELMYTRRQHFLTYQGFESIVKKLHLDAEGQIIEPFVALADQEDRNERQRIWHENLVLDLEEECLIK
jgi:hypothetical protein